jgi:hypothetical protein
MALADTAPRYDMPQPWLGALRCVIADSQLR